MRMELTRPETAALEEVVAIAMEFQLQELESLQLTLVGGGIGDPIAA
jgi:hypothetical protein